jgi:hypothetical protein
LLLLVPDIFFWAEPENADDPFRVRHRRATFPDGQRSEAENLPLKRPSKKNRPERELFYRRYPLFMIEGTSTG